MNELLHVFTHSFTWYVLWARQLGEKWKYTQDTIPILMDLPYNQGLRVWEG